MRPPVFLYPMKNPRLFAVLPLLLAGFWATVPAADNVTTPEQLFPQLDVILKHAVAQSPRMISRTLDLEMADQARIGARAGLLPSAGGYFSYYRADEDRADLNGRNWVKKVAYNFSASQPIFHWGERRNNDKMGEIRRIMASGQYREGYRLFAQEVRSLYLHIILDKLRHTKAISFRDFTANQAKVGEERLNKKVISEAQIFSIRMDAERAQVAAERAAFDLENDKAAFARLTSTPVLKDEEIPDLIPPIAPEPDRYKNLLAGYLASKDLPSFEAVNTLQTLQLERLNLANQKTRLRPKFNFVVGISQDEQSYTANIAQKYQVSSYYGGISANWSIFDGFSAGAGERTALARIRQLELDYSGLTERLAQQAQTQLRLIDFDARYVSLNDRLLKSGEGYLSLKKEEFSRGVASEETVSGAVVNLYDAQLTAYTTRMEYYMQVCEFLGSVMQDPVLANLPVK